MFLKLIFHSNNLCSLIYFLHTTNWPFSFLFCNPKLLSIELQHGYVLEQDAVEVYRTLMLGPMTLKLIPASYLKSYHVLADLVRKSGENKSFDDVCKPFFFSWSQFFIVFCFNTKCCSTKVICNILINEMTTSVALKIVNPKIIKAYI